MSHPIWSNIFKGFKGKESQTEIALKQVPVFADLKKRELKDPNITDLEKELSDKIGLTKYQDYGPLPN